VVCSQQRACLTKLHPTPTSNAGDSLSILLLPCGERERPQAFSMSGHAGSSAHYRLEMTQC
jgi:hypothetical protein